MNIFSIIKGVFSKMFSNKTIENAISITPNISNAMQQSIELWEDMYMGREPWVNKNVKSLGLPSMIASEKSRMATIEMEIKITGDSERAKFISSQFDKVIKDIREQLEYGIALGGLVIKPYVTLGIDNKYIISFNYTRANNFYPLSFSAEGDITEACFIDRIITKEKVYSKLEYHRLDGNILYIKNLSYVTNANNLQVASDMSSELGNPIPLTEIKEWSAIAPEVTIDNVDTLLFAYFKMPEANTVDLNSPLGASGFSRAVKLIEQADKQYSNLLWEFEGGQLAVDVDRTALNLMKDASGRETTVLPELQDRLFRRSLDLGKDETYNVFSPQLRDSNIINGLNSILAKIEDSCALSRGTLSEVVYSEARTATELKILKQRSYSANSDIQKSLQRTLEQVIDIMDKYCDLYDINPKGDFEVAYCWDDSIIVDKDAERQIDMMDLQMGLMSKVEYRIKWMGETEKQAIEALAKIKQEQIDSVEISSMMGVNTSNSDSGIKQAVASKETTKIN